MVVLPDTVDYQDIIVDAPHLSPVTYHRREAVRWCNENRDVVEVARFWADEGNGYMVELLPAYDRGYADVIGFRIKQLVVQYYEELENVERR